MTALVSCGVTLRVVSRTLFLFVVCLRFGYGLIGLRPWRLRRLVLLLVCVCSGLFCWLLCLVLSIVRLIVLWRAVWLVRTLGRCWFMWCNWVGVLWRRIGRMVVVVVLMVLWRLCSVLVRWRCRVRRWCLLRLL